MGIRLGNYVFSWGSVPQIKVGATRALSMEVIKGILLKYRPEYIRVTDPAKIAYDLPTMRQLGAADLVKLKPYVLNDWDCEDFAGEMKADADQLLIRPAFGVVDVRLPDGGLHCLNFFISDTLAVFYFEPQTGEIFAADSVTYKPYFFSL